jgi:hypothetical protein
LSHTPFALNVLLSGSDSFQVGLDRVMAPSVLTKASLSFETSSTNLACKRMGFHFLLLRDGDTFAQAIVARDPVRIF